MSKKKKKQMSLKNSTVPQSPVSNDPTPIKPQKNYHNSTNECPPAYNTSLNQKGLFRKFDVEDSYAVASRPKPLNKWRDFTLVFVLILMLIGGVFYTVVNFGFIDDPFEANKDEGFVFVSNNSDKRSTNGTSEIKEIDKLHGGLFYVESPTSNDVYEGQFFAFGQVDPDVSDLKIDIYDDNGNHLASETPVVTTSQSGPFSWSTYVDIKNSPFSSTGYVKYQYLTIDGEIEQTFPISFDSVRSVDDLEIFGPVKDQLSNGKIVEFFGTSPISIDQEFNVSLVADSDEIIVSDTLSLSAGVLSGSVEVPMIPVDQYVRGSWKVSDEDGVVVANIPVRFHEGF